MNMEKRSALDRLHTITTTINMPASYLSRHRPLCDVLQEIQDAAVVRGDIKTIKLCDEAIDYARRMSAKLVEYKQLTTKQ